MGRFKNSFDACIKSMPHLVHFNTSMSYICRPLSLFHLFIWFFVSFYFFLNLYVTFKGKIKLIHLKRFINAVSTTNLEVKTCRIQISVLTKRLCIFNQKGNQSKFWKKMKLRYSSDLKRDLARIAKLGAWAEILATIEAYFFLNKVNLDVANISAWWILT